MRQFLILTCVIMASLVYSTGLQQVVLPEHTLDKPETLWQRSSFHGDAGEYLSDDPIAPYRYRVLPLFLARSVTAFWILNAASAFLVGVLFTLYLLRDFSQMLSLLGGVLAVTSLAMQRTLIFPMVEPLSLLMALFVFWSLRERHAAAFLVSAVLAVMTKEVFIAAAPLWIVHTQPRRWWVAVAPLVTFVLIRLLSGAPPAEVNYGYNILAGELPDYAMRFVEPAGMADLLTRLFLAFGFVWMGLANIGRDPFLKRSAMVYIPLVILAAVLLSSRIARVIGILYPVLIPSFLLFFTEDHCV